MGTTQAYKYLHMLVFQSFQTRTMMMYNVWDGHSYFFVAFLIVNLGSQNRIPVHVVIIKNFKLILLINHYLASKNMRQPWITLKHVIESAYLCYCSLSNFHL